MGSSEALDAIFHHYRTMEKPKSSSKIENSEAFSYLADQIVLKENFYISNDIFAILTADLLKYKKDAHYFSFIEKIISYFNFNEDILINQLSAMSFDKCRTQLFRYKFLLYLSLVSPKILNNIYVGEKANAVQNYFVIMESVFRFECDKITSKYISALLDILKFIEINPNKNLIFILANYTEIFRYCSNFNSCHPNDAQYFRQLADLYEQQLQPLDKWTD